MPIVCVILGAVTDFFDGHIARKMNATSKIGELIDPIADKIFINTVLWGICAYSGFRSLAFILVAILLSLRDLATLFGGAYILVKNIDIKMRPTFSSKVCTALLFLLCFLKLTKLCQNYVFILEYMVLLLIAATIIVYSCRFLQNKRGKS